MDLRTEMENHKGLVMGNVSVQYWESYREIDHNTGREWSYSRGFTMNGEKNDVKELLPITFKSLPDMSSTVLDLRDEEVKRIISSLRNKRLTE